MIFTHQRVQLRCCNVTSILMQSINDANIMNISKPSTIDFLLNTPALITVYSQPLMLSVATGYWIENALFVTRFVYDLLFIPQTRVPNEPKIVIITTLFLRCPGYDPGTCTC